MCNLLMKLDLCLLIINGDVVCVKMFWLLVFFLGRCLAEWPPRLCDPQVNITQNTVTLTSPALSRQEYSCTLQDRFEDAIFIDLERQYSNRRFTKAHDSILGLTMSHPGGEFSVRVHNDRIETNETPRQCRGIFASQRTRLKIEFRALPELLKTFVSVMKWTNNQFVRCLTFELDKLIYGVTLKVHAITDTGMIQRIHDISKHDKKNKKVEEELVLLKNQLSMTQTTLRTTIERLEQNHLLVHDKHTEMQKALENSMRHSDTRIALKVRHHSYGFISVIVLSSILMCAFVKYNSYAKKRIEHIL